MNDATHKAADLTLAEVEQRFWSMHGQSRSEPPNSAAERRSLLKALRQVISASAPMFVEAIAQDYGHRSRNETLLAEVVPALIMAGGALRNLKAWMRPERRGRSIASPRASC
jgi:coniferyl-aldehyde dehydrogenase